MFSFHYLPNKKVSKMEKSVSILIPARNEELNIGGLLEILDACSSSILEILVYDDCSTDGTAAVVNDYARKNRKFKLIHGGALPNGWLGKNNACHQLACAAKGDTLLFLDADVKIRDGAIARAMHHMQMHDLHLLSVFPKQIMSSIGEKVTVPLMNWILLSLLPLILIRRSKNPAFSAANGQFMMFRADVYKNHFPHQLFKNNMVEDIAIIKYFKMQRLKSDTLLGTSDIECRMYEGADQAINGFSKNIFHFFGNSIAITLLFALLRVCLFYILGIVLIRIFVSIASRQSPWQNSILLPLQHAAFLVIIGKRLANNGKKELIWKGRNVL
jgi:glycosyltransferase involved in cell wall biosynthesis